MADDIDDLLNEAAEYLDDVKLSEKRKPDDKCGSNNVLWSGSTVKKDSSQTNRESDISAMIDDILDDNSADNKHSKKSITNNSDANKNVTKLASIPGNISRQNKCFRVWLGGSENKTGISTAVYQRCCDSLRCTDCDFSVSMFDNYHWHSSTDYLFLRNNMPEFYRLKSKLSANKGFRAYACQCKWKSIKDLTPVESLKHIKWVCGRHKQITEM